MHRTLVSTADLAGHLDGSWAIVDCRFNLQDEAWGHDQYRRGHVPSAVYAHLSTDLAGATTGANGRHPLPSVDDMARVFSGLGIDRTVQVVTYDQDAGMYASRLWWMLRYLGHEAVAVLDGGWARWVGEGRPVREGEESRRPARFEAMPRATMLASLNDVATLTGDAATRLVDARAPERYEGRSETIDRAAGHIPGAVNCFFKGNVTAEGTWQSPGALRERFAAVLDGRSPERVVMYCGSGVTACHNLLAMEHAGLTGARLYPGSWSEWSSDPARPIETGTRPT